jgi:antitoxin (DNA-binding transcriptional repressor) of toxin-antitoxin stability system
MGKAFKITATEARKGFKATLNRVRQGERAVIFNHDRIVGAIVSPDDYRLLRAIRAREDAEDVRDALAAMQEEGEIPWEQVKAELGL